MSFMDGAIRCGEIELRLEDFDHAEERIQWAQQAYGFALRFAGRTSFDVREVSGFELKTIQLEAIIRKLQVRLTLWKELNRRDRAATDSEMSNSWTSSTQSVR
jgi:hypothetical protein